MVTSYLSNRKVLTVVATAFCRLKVPPGTRGELQQLSVAGVPQLAGRLSQLPTCGQEPSSQASDATSRSATGASSGASVPPSNVVPGGRSVRSGQPAPR